MGDPTESSAAPAGYTGGVQHLYLDSGCGVVAPGSAIRVHQVVLLEGDSALDGTPARLLEKTPFPNSSPVPGILESVRAAGWGDKAADLSDSNALPAPRPSIPGVHFWGAFPDPFLSALQLDGHGRPD